MQLSLYLPERLKRGGARPGAGRKPKPGRRPAPHRPRHPLSRHHPLHIVVRLVPGVSSLRTRKLFGRVHRALAAAKERFGMRIIHYSVQANHLHLLVEVDCSDKAGAKRALTKAMQGLGVRLARRLNKVLGRRGRLIEERYHVTRLTTPRQVNSALLHILNNGRKHRAERGLPCETGWLDPCAIGVYFEHWGEQVSGITAWQSWVRQLDEQLGQSWSAERRCAQVVAAESRVAQAWAAAPRRDSRGLDVCRWAATRRRRLTLAGDLPGASRRRAGASRWANAHSVWNAKSSRGRFAHPES